MTTTPQTTPQTGPHEDSGTWTAPQLSSRKILTIMSGLLLGMLLAALDQTIVSTALPRIVGDLGGLENIDLVTTAYLLASTVTTPMWGKLGDLLGRKYLFQLAILNSAWPGPDSDRCRRGGGSCCSGGRWGVAGGGHLGASSAAHLR